MKTVQPREWDSGEPARYEVAVDSLMAVVQRLDEEITRLQSICFGPRPEGACEPPPESTPALSSDLYVATWSLDKALSRLKRINEELHSELGSKKIA